MKYLCAFCKVYATASASGEKTICYCPVKAKDVEPWFVACTDRFRDRREGRDAWVLSERRRRTGFPAAA